VRFPADETVHGILTSAAFKQSSSGTRGDNPLLDDQTFRTVATQLLALGLVALNYSETVGGGMGLFRAITPSGERLMMELRTEKKPVEHTSKEIS
jgi:hypothetical protein